MQHADFAHDAQGRRIETARLELSAAALASCQPEVSLISPPDAFKSGRQYYITAFRFGQMPHFCFGLDAPACHWALLF